MIFRPMVEPGVLKVFFDEERDRLTVVERDEEGQVFGSHHRAEHSFFLAKEEATRDVVQMLSESRYLKKLSFEGNWVRAIWDRRETCESIAELLMPKKASEDGDYERGDEEGIGTYDVAIPPWLRHALDHGVKFVRPRGCYLDFEGDSRVPFGKKQEARILCWAIVDGATRESFTAVLEEDSDDAERAVLEKLLERLDGYDQIIAWNGDRYDFPLFRARVKRLGIGRDVRRWLTLDHLKLFKRANAHAAESGDEKQSFALDEIAPALLGKEEGSKKFDASKSWEMWEAGGQSRQDLVDGCLHDTDRLYRLEAATGYLAMFASVCELTGVHHDSSGTNPNAQVESFLLRLAKEKDFRFRMKNVRRSSENEEEQVEREEKFKGAEVIKPAEKGIIKDVHVVDFSRMYPSIILTWNMSPETIVEKPEPPPAPPNYLRHTKAWDEWETTVKACDVPPPGVVVAPGTDRWFRTDKRGILCLAVAELVNLRKQVSEKKAKLPPGTPEWLALDRLDQALKIVLNSFYGVVGSRAFRFCDRDVAEAVARAGVWLIRRTVQEAKARIAASLLYGDTDSGMLYRVIREAVEQFTALCNDELFPAWLREQGCYENGGIKIAYEKAYERIVFPLSSEGEPVAKRYCCPPDSPIWMVDSSFKRIGDIKPGDEVVGWSAGNAAKRQALCKSTVTFVRRRLAHIVKVTTAGGRTIRCTADHRWLRKRRLQYSRGPYRYSYSWQTPKVGRELVHVIDQPKELPIELREDAAWLGGIWDGEGSLCSDNRAQIVFAQSPKVNPEVCAKIEEVCKRLGFDLSLHKVAKNKDCNRYALKGDKQMRLNFVAWCKPAKAPRFVKSFLRSKFATGDRIVKVEPDGWGEVVSLTTTTGNYIVHGFASKNCARLLHFKGVPATEETEPEIKGLEYKRGDSSRMTRSFQKAVVDMLMRDRCEESSTFRAVVGEWRRKVLEDELALRDIVLSQSLSKPLGQYARKAKKYGKKMGMVELVAETTSTVQVKYLATGELVRYKRADVHEDSQVPKLQKGELLLIEWNEGPAHVRVARELAKRGRDVGEGTRVQYVIVDGKVSPKAVIPVEDYDGKFDRESFWEDQVWPATARVLRGAFPHSDWQEFDRAVEREVSPGRRGGRKQGGPQIGLFER